MSYSPVRIWFVNKTRQESRAALVHVLVLLILLVIAVGFALGVLYGIGFIFGYMAPWIYVSLIGISFLTFPSIRNRISFKDAHTKTDVVLSLLFLSPFLLWEAGSELHRAYKIHRMAPEPFLVLLQQAWESKVSVSTEILSTDFDEAILLAERLAELHGIYYSPDYGTIGLSDKSMAEIGQHNK